MVDSDNFLKQSIRKCCSKLVIVIFFSFFINLLMFVAPLHMLQIYDRVLVSRSEVTLIVLTALALGLLIIYGLLEGVRSRILVRLGLQFDELVSSQIFNTIFENAIRRPNLSSPQALKDVDTIRDFMSAGAIVSFCDAPWVPIFIFGCFILHPMLGYVALGGTVIVFAIAACNEWATRRKLAEANRISLQSANYAVTSLRNAEIVKALGMIPGVKAFWTDRHVEMLNNQSSASDRATYIVATSRAVRMCLQVLILATGGYLAIQDLISPGAMIAASIIMGRALAPVEMAVFQWKNFIGARESFSRLSRLLDAAPEKKESMDLPVPTGKIDLEAIFVQPPESNSMAVTNFSMSFSPGTVTGVVGPSGSGKSSLSRALVGVWPLARGYVRYDGASIENWSSEKLGPFIGYMPQDVELFSGTVAENIARFTEQDSTEIVKAAKKAGVHELILQLPEGYDTNIGVGGQALSGGQRQRLALARAVYKEPKVIILDEPNSNLDSEGEKALAETILGAKQAGATVIVVSHRPSLLACTDKIAVLNKGILVKHGDRDQILSELGGGRNVASSPPAPANN